MLVRPTLTPWTNLPPNDLDYYFSSSKKIFLRQPCDTVIHNLHFVHHLAVGVQHKTLRKQVALDHPILHPQDEQSQLELRDDTKQMLEPHINYDQGYTWNPGNPAPEIAPQSTNLTPGTAHTSCWGTHIGHSSVSLFIYWIVVEIEVLLLVVGGVEGP